MFGYKQWYEQSEKIAFLKARIFIDRSMQAKGFTHAPKILLKHQKWLKQENTYKQRESHVKEIVKENNLDDELLVFGYASKLYPPDLHSSSIAKNKHLILWNEDHKVDLLLDRYDCRASLYDLSEFDGDSWNKVYKLSEEEMKLEEHLDEERYRALKVNETEETIRQEEELRRLHASITTRSYGQVGFEYECTPSAPTPPEHDKEENVDEKPFFAPVSLAVPKEMEIPPTEKMQAIIEKTADFVSKQGTQMEIVLKAKQSNNTQFQFLQYGHYLNPYYKHMVVRIKEGKYKPGVKENEEQEDSDSSSDGEGYLHPSLFASAHKQHDKEKDEKTKAIRTIDPDHPLAKLIEKGRAANAAKQYQQMVDTVYKYYNQQCDGGPASAQQVEPPPLPPFETMTTQFSTDIDLSHCPDHQFIPPPPGEDVHMAPPLNIPIPSWDGPEQIVPPPPDVQPVVEAIARKVAQEGEQTEMSLAMQDQPNLAFLRPWHELHPYYKYRKIAWTQALQPPPPPEMKQNGSGTGNVESLHDENVVDEGLNKSSTPISFSIKQRSETNQKKLPVPSTKASKVLAESDDDDDSQQKDATSNENQKVRRRFTEEPETQILCVKENSAKSLLEEVSVASNTDEWPKPKQEITEKDSNVEETNPPKLSNFTAVTSSGQLASVSLLRQKQQARRIKALQFLESKKQEATIQKQSETDEETIAANEDIFDLSNSPKLGMVPINEDLHSSVPLISTSGSSTPTYSSKRIARKRHKHGSRDRSTSPKRKHKRSRKHMDRRRENGKKKKKRKKVKMGGSDREDGGRTSSSSAKSSGSECEREDVADDVIKTMTNVDCLKSDGEIESD